MRRETSGGQTERGDLSFGVPQGFAQLHPGEGFKRFVTCHCVPFLLTGIYDHSRNLLLVLRAFRRECVSRPKLALSLPIKGPSL